MPKRKCMCGGDAANYANRPLLQKLKEWHSDIRAKQSISRPLRHWGYPKLSKIAEFLGYGKIRKRRVRKR